ncbi:hypothetical protein WJX74_007005 [Apatococcus lobatus]|uniref:Uncharacterized protein n=1 Tax=Apatococcus lobatus TaxID=904363 RepID=A0AAW1RBR0_9CHLO
MPPDLGSRPLEVKQSQRLAKARIPTYLAAKAVLERSGLHTVAAQALLLHHQIAVFKPAESWLAWTNFDWRMFCPSPPAAHGQVLLSNAFDPLGRD